MPKVPTKTWKPLSRPASLARTSTSANLSLRHGNGNARHLFQNQERNQVPVDHLHATLVVPQQRASSSTLVTPWVVVLGQPRHLRLVLGVVSARHGDRNDSRKGSLPNCCNPCGCCCCSRRDRQQCAVVVCSSTVYNAIKNACQAGFRRMSEFPDDTAISAHAPYKGAPKPLRRQGHCVPRTLHTVCSRFQCLGVVSLTLDPESQYQ